MPAAARARRGRCGLGKTAMSGQARTYEWLRARRVCTAG